MLMWTTVATSGILLQKHACVQLSTLPSPLTFTPVTSNSECAVMCTSASCAGVAIDDEAGGKQCALLTQEDLPLSNTNQPDNQLTVTVFKDINVNPITTTAVPTSVPTVVAAGTNTPTCTSTSTPCVIWVHGTCFCLKNYDQTTNEQSQAKSICISQYGSLAKLPEADSSADLLAIHTWSQSGNVKQGQVWLSADDEETQGTYKWPGGQHVDGDLWHTGEPNQADERCTAALLISGVAVMVDVTCSGGGTARNIVCAVPNCSDC